MRNLGFALALSLVAAPVSADGGTGDFFKVNNQNEEELNLLEHVDWATLRENLPSAEELEESGIDPSQLETMRPYVPDEYMDKLKPATDAIEWDPRKWKNGE